MSGDQPADDYFDKILKWEEAQYTEGYEAGWQAGVGEAAVEGVKLGAEAGSIAGSRLGYVSGYLQVIKKIIPKLNPSERTLKNITTLTTLLDTANTSALDEELIQKIEAKFTVLTQQLRVKPTGVSTASLTGMGQEKATDLSF
eukprot:TRINITY_DN1352_c1_g3_i1.p1 TRINITY_DN1352_c1_g3~~TRINITY_DN1352_c1_g3_i1.p1  ORF type:complete len:143 (+),score=35.34 TRINITY_DN1352_c1_g3_i1:46-474(+)